MRTVARLALMAVVTVALQGCGIASFYCLEKQPTPNICSVP